MSYQMVFARHELKYLLTRKQKNAILESMGPYMSPDEYGPTTIRNIYFDTGSFRLIRRSMEHPAYKEKLRLRSYRPSAAADPVFVELKKKYKAVVYKRRLLMPQAKAMNCLCSGKPLPLDSQIAREIDYFCSYYRGLAPKVFLSYDRQAYQAQDGSGFRVTFDENILSRREDFSFDRGIYGTPLLKKDMTLMEIKTPGGIPLWMTHCLTDNRIFKTSFSKYATAYQNTILCDGEGGVLRA